jgi:epoxyqueuosine reductase
MEQYIENIREYATENGAHLVGFAPVSRFDGAPRGHHPMDYLPGCKTVVAIGIRMLDRGLDHRKMAPKGLNG